jgi:hypothetical protein
MKAGWMDLRPATKPGQVSSLTLLSGNTPEGRLIQRGRAQMPGGKVIDDGTASDLLAAFANSGFDRFAVRANPTQGPAAAMAVVWIDRGSGYESLFFLPGARRNPETADLPDVYDGLKKLILGIHQATPGSAVTTGQGWSGDDLLKQKPGDPGR